ncbi:MAG: hypothetical protein Kow00104_00600 [Rhodothalassiaceae bacterium]
MSAGDGTMTRQILSAVPEDDAEAIIGRFELQIGTTRIPVEARVPAGAVRTRDLLPLLGGLADLFADRAAARACAAGRPPSCRAGCGACCHQAVPVSASEALFIAQLIATMPEPRRGVLKERFAAARARIAKSGLMARRDRLGGEEVAAFGLSYFGLGIACPFLEDGSCSIHPVRPLACREYLVTSPAPRCAAPSAESIDMLPLEASLSRALRNYEREAGWTLLSLALDFTCDEPAARPAPEILAGLLARL